MKNTPVYAVINGDIIGSTKLKEAERDSFIKRLKKEFATLKKGKQFGVLKPFELYRGDSFQGATSKPEQALRLVLLLHSFTRMQVGKDLGKRLSGLPPTPREIRLAIGIGKASRIAGTLMESHGDAFNRSGHLIDQMKKQGLRIAIETPWAETNRILDVSFTLLSVIIRNWSPSQAEVVFHSLHGHSQKQISRKLKITDSAVNQRLKSSNWNAIKKLTGFFEEIILKSK